MLLCSSRLHVNKNSPTASVLYRLNVLPQDDPHEKIHTEALKSFSVLVVIICALVGVYINKKYFYIRYWANKNLKIKLYDNTQ
jgi:hypothetical protein